ncbi:MAG: hypothetical protein ACE5OZ_25060 [Candidatus Heimdallarchaeota archaeon]
MARTIFEQTEDRIFLLFLLRESGPVERIEILENLVFLASFYAIDEGLPKSFNYRFIKLKGNALAYELAGDIRDLVGAGLVDVEVPTTFFATEEGLEFLEETLEENPDLVDRLKSINIAVMKYREGTPLLKQIKALSTFQAAQNGQLIPS